MNTHQEEAMVNGNIDTSDGNAQNTGADVVFLPRW